MTYLADDTAPEHQESHNILHLIEGHLDLHRSIRSVIFDSDTTHSITMIMETGSVWKLDLHYINSQEIKNG